jgi:murein DD-endopeptidase MepM/ murein hydrolase activator NlpD
VIDGMWHRVFALLPLLLISPCLAAPMVPPAPSEIALSDMLLTGRIEQGGTATGTVPSGTLSLMLDGKPVDIAPDGRFLIGFGRDAPAEAMLIATLADGRHITKVLTIAPHQWRIEQVDTPMRPPAIPDEDYQRIRAGELQQIEAARAIRPSSNGWRQPLMWPVTGRISGVFGSQRIYQGVAGSYHGGVDIARPTGTMIAAPADGVVILAAVDTPFTLEGHLLMIDHGMGLTSAFLHLSRIDVKVGDHVTRGQVLGAIGTSGRSTGPHLHWGMKWQDERIDPQMLLPPMTAAP